MKRIMPLLIALLVSNCATAAPPPPPPTPQPTRTETVTEVIKEVRIEKQELTVRLKGVKASIHEDDFNHVKTEWEQSAGIWQTSDGRFKQKSDDARHFNAIQYVHTPRIADATIETRVQVLPSRPNQWTSSPEDQELQRNIRFIFGAGIIFRMKDKNNYYMFRLAGEEGAVLARMVAGKWNEKDLCNPRVRDFLEGYRIGFGEGNWYHLKVEAYGSRIKAYIDGEPVCSVVDDTFSLGHYGLVTFKTPADFDYALVYDKTNVIIEAQQSRGK